MGIRRYLLLISILALVIAACGGAEVASTTTGVTSPPESTTTETTQPATPEGQASTLDDAASAVLQARPLSPRDFAPWIREVGDQSITVEWRESSFIDYYAMERSMSPDGPS